ncbi:hypothetical protein FO519_002273 [Halicephalobus sp. NKZ332]|nr:hypothetical protein FO519_002273 [Halicephalobus sp. NKZ332]
MSKHSASVPMSQGPVIHIDDSLVREEENIAEAMNGDEELEEEDELNNIDKIFKAIKSYGPYQIFFFATCQIMSISNAMSMVAGFFRLGNLVPNYSCNDDNYNWTLTASVVRKNSPLACEMITNCSSLTTTNYWYSMYEEYNWVCTGSDHLLATFQSLLPIGTFFGFMVSGHLSDHFGRKWILIFGEIYSTLSGIACSLIPSFMVYSVFTIFGSFIGPISAAASFSLIVESVNPKYRLIQGFSFQFSLGLMDAADALTRIARFNGVEDIQFTKEQMQKIHLNNKKAQQKSLQSLNDTRKYSVKDLFANWKMTTYAISQVITGITMNIVNDVLFFNIQDLAGNPFLNTFLMGALRLWTPFAAFALENGTQTVGRRKLLIFSQGAVFFFFFFMFIIKLTDLDPSMKAVGTIMTIIGYTLESGLVWIAYKLYTTELFPTCVRSIALSTFSCTSLIGSIITPQLTYLARFWNPAPFTGAALASGLSCILAIIFLPETHFVALPDTIDQATHRKFLYKENGLTTFSKIYKDRRSSTNISISINEREDRKIILNTIEK